MARSRGVELSAWESSDAWMKRKKLSLSVRDYHSLHWLLYVYLQQGRYNQAEQLLNLMKKVMSESTYDNKLRPATTRTTMRTWRRRSSSRLNDGTSPLTLS